MVDPQAVGLGIVAGLWWSLMGYRLFAEPGEKFDPAKLLRTLIWGTLVGAWAGSSGLPVDVASLDLEHKLAAIGALGMVTASLEQASIWIWGVIRERVKRARRPPT